MGARNSVTKKLKSDSIYEQFRREACQLIHQNDAHADDLKQEVYELLSDRYFLGEEVTRYDDGQTYKVVDVKTEDSGEIDHELRYTVQSKEITISDLKLADLCRVTKIGLEDVRSFIEQVAAENDRKLWIVRRSWRERYGLTRPTTRLQRAKRWWSVKFSDDDSRRHAILATFTIIWVFLTFLLIGVAIYDHYFVSKDNARLLPQATELVLQMNETTANRFWKTLITKNSLKFTADPEAVEAMAKLFEFESTTANRTTLSEYVKRMQTSQENIFYAYDRTSEEIKSLAAVKSLVRSGFEVLMLTDEVDKLAVGQLERFEGKTFMNARRWLFR